jgi:ankyrin repeat protein
MFFRISLRLYFITSVFINCVQNGSTALIEAVTSDSTEIVGLLIAKGADLNIQDVVCFRISCRLILVLLLLSS